MSWGSLRNIWGRTADKGETKLTLRDGNRAYFQVTDPDIARRMADWLVRRDEAEQAVAVYLRKASPMLGGETPFYKVDKDGYVDSINFRYGMGFTHIGWKGKGCHTNWLSPEEDSEDGERVRAELRQLPPLPSYSEINQLMMWPEAFIDELFQDTHLPGYEEFAERANRQIHVSRSLGHIYVSVPYPDTFADYPKLETEISKWNPPEFLRRIDDRMGQKIEKHFAFSRSALGRVVASALMRLAR